MSVNGWLVADCDMHVMEPADLWQRYMDPAWEHAIPVGLDEIERDMRVKVKNSVLLRLGHLRGALNVGISKEELVEVLMQVGVYAGVPLGVAALGTAASVLGTE